VIVTTKPEIVPFEVTFKFGSTKVAVLFVMVFVVEVPVTSTDVAAD
jgi:hypothetical protein